MTVKLLKQLLLSLFIGVISFSCNEKPAQVDLTKSQKALMLKLENYQWISGDSLTHSNNFIDKYILAKWSMVNENYKSANRLFSEIEIEMSKLSIYNPIYQNYILDKITIGIYLNNSDIDFTLKMIKKVDVLKSKDLLYFKVRLLVHLSAILRNNTEINFSFCSSAYAISLLSKLELNDLEESKIFFNHSINLIREVETGPDKFFMMETAKRCNDLNNPLCKKIKLLELFTQGVNELDKIDSTLLKELLDTNYFAPRYKRFISTQIGWMIKDKKKKERFLRKGNGKNDFCNKGFLNTLYMVDDLLDLNELDSAQFYLDILTTKCDMTKEKYEYIFLRRMMRFNMLKYSKSQNLNFLYLALQNAENSFSIRSNSFRKKDGFHFADFIYLNFIDQLECYFQLFKRNNIDNSLYNRYIQCLRDGRSFEKNITSYSDQLALQLDKDNYNKYTNILKLIDSLEIEVGRYRDTIIRKPDVYKILFDSYVKKYNLEKSIVNKPQKQKQLQELNVYRYLKDHSAQIIEYNISSQTIYISNITKNGIKINKVNINIDSLVNKYLQKIFNKSKTDNISNLLYNTLVKNNIDTTVKNIIIIPSGVLSKLPYESLKYNNKYLVDQYNISYDFDIGSVISQKQSHCKNTVLIYSFSSEKTINNRAKIEVPELIFGLKEAKSIRDLYINSELLSGSEFNTLSLKKMANADIIHLSTHSFSDPNKLFHNYMMIRNNDRSIKKIYGFEIRGLNLTASNVILSSCESGKGVYKPGAGTISFSKAFINNGSKSVTKSLWKVNDISTSKLMIEYHKAINSGFSFSKALTNAKRKLKMNKKYSHPYFWAGFVLEGNPNIRFNK